MRKKNENAEQPASGLNPLWVATHPDGLTTPQPAQQEPAHSLGPGQMELSLRRNYKDELFECRRRFSAEEVMHGPDWLVEKVAKQLDAEMDNAIQAWSNT